MERIWTECFDISELSFGENVWSVWWMLVRSGKVECGKAPSVKVWCILLREEWRVMSEEGRVVSERWGDELGGE